MPFMPELAREKIFFSLETKKRLTDFYVISSLIYGQSTYDWWIKMVALEISSFQKDIHNSMDESFKQNGDKTKIYAQNQEETTQNYQTHNEERRFG